MLVRHDLGLVEQLLRRRHGLHGSGEIHLDYFGDYFDLPHWGFETFGDVDRDEVEHDDDEAVMDSDASDFDFEEAGSIREVIGSELADQLLDLLDELGLPPGGAEQSLRDLIWEMRFSPILHGPPGWIPRLRPRQLLGLRVEGGALRAVAVDRVETTQPVAVAAAARMGDLARRLLGPARQATPADDWDGFVPIDQFLEWIAMDLPDALRQPMPPLVEALEGAGLVVEDGYVGLPVPGARLDVEDLRTIETVRSLGSRGLVS